jgi:hypothetical protein
MDSARITKIIQRNGELDRGRLALNNTLNTHLASLLKVSKKVADQK